MKRKTGFTLIEMLVSMVILVMAFALITMLYVRASRIRTQIIAGSEVQGVLTQMVQAIGIGQRNDPLKNLSSATKIYNHPKYTTPTTIQTLLMRASNALIFGNLNESMVQYYLIAPGLDSGSPKTTGSDITLWYAEGAYSPDPATTMTWHSLDVNKRVYLSSGSAFTFYDIRMKFPNMKDPPDAADSETTFVKIHLAAISADPSMKNMAPVIFETTVRARNKLSF